MEDLNNFNGMLEVAAALDNASVHRLEATFKVQSSLNISITSLCQYRNFL